jgi:hypothetical protein
MVSPSVTRVTVIVSELAGIGASGSPDSPADERAKSNSAWGTSRSGMVEVVVVVDAWVVVVSPWLVVVDSTTVVGEAAAVASSTGGVRAPPIAVRSNDVPRTAAPARGNTPFAKRINDVDQTEQEADQTGQT